jgi:hypothetical protein
MKTNYTLFSIFLSACFSVFAQSTFQITTESGVVVAANDVYEYTTSPETTTEGSFDIKNISATTQTFTVRRYDDVLNTVSAGDVAQASFCTGSNCYPPSITNAVVVLSPGAKSIFKPSLFEASATGLSQIRYKFSNANNTSEALTITLKYANTVSLVKNDFNLFNEVSIFPNPASSNAALILNSNSELRQANVSIINSLGAEIMFKTIELNIGKNSVPLSLEGLSQGIYFISMTGSGKSFTKKLIISK